MYFLSYWGSGKPKGSLLVILHLCKLKIKGSGAVVKSAKVVKWLLATTSLAQQAGSICLLTKQMWLCKPLGSLWSISYYMLFSGLYFFFSLLSLKGISPKHSQPFTSYGVQCRKIERVQKQKTMDHHSFCLKQEIDAMLVVAWM